MESFNVQVNSISKATHDVLVINTTKPSGIRYHPGQATEISIDKEGWREERRPFTFTSLPEYNYLEFTIKTYPSHSGVTNELLRIQPGQGLILHDVFGDIAYSGEGLFIAGGAGITPFISIFRDLKSKNAVGNNKLIFANRTRNDIIHEAEFQSLLGVNFINVLSDESAPGYEHGFISKALVSDLLTPDKDKVYLCGPPPMMDALDRILDSLQVRKDNVVKEAF